jgi:hypothetical protein
VAQGLSIQIEKQLLAIGLSEMLHENHTKRPQFAVSVAFPGLL